MEVDLPNKNSMNVNTELMPFKKFVEKNNQLYHEQTKKLKGTFKEIPTNQIIKGDDFEAHIIGKGTPEETYKMYIKWFNHTKTEQELERQYVFAEFERE